jgi:hypothetical protein
MLSGVLFDMTGTARVVMAFALLRAGVPEGWKAADDRGNRYEGSVRVPVGNPDMELLSFVGLLEPFPEGVNLRVRFFLPTQAVPFISAQELRDRNHTAWRSSHASGDRHSGMSLPRG